ncbi:MAG: alpha/beta hydrolase [Pseudomonadaceae bacterium]|nr:alpha/beta hydrolase [Pseudomonadaceae bacterium]
MNIAAPTPKEISINALGLTLRAQQWGNPEGEPTFALHGWLDNAATFARLAPELPELNLIALDSAGHGLSEHRPAGVPYVPMFDVQELLAAAAWLEWETFNLIGHSRGAALAGEFAGYFPERVEKVVLIDNILTTGGATPRERISINRYTMKQSLRALDREVPIYPDLDSLIALVCKNTKVSQDAARLLLERGHIEVDGGVTWRTDPKLRTRTPLRLPCEQVDEIMRRSASPALLIIAEEGEPWFHDELERRQEHHPNLATITLPGTHHLHLEADTWAAVAAEIRAFLGL